MPRPHDGSTELLLSRSNHFIHNCSRLIDSKRNLVDNQWQQSRSHRFCSSYSPHRGRKIHTIHRLDSSRNLQTTRQATSWHHQAAKPWIKQYLHGQMFHAPDSLGGKPETSMGDEFTVIRSSSVTKIASTAILQESITKKIR